MQAGRLTSRQAHSHTGSQQKAEVHTVERGQEVIVVLTFEGVNDRGEEGDVMKLTEGPWRHITVRAALMSPH